MTSQKRQSKAPTVADVARAAKVSKAQAARALGGYGAVSDEVESQVDDRNIDAEKRVCLNSL